MLHSQQPFSETLAKTIAFLIAEFESAQDDIVPRGDTTNGIDLSLDTQPG